MDRRPLHHYRELLLAARRQLVADFLDLERDLDVLTEDREIELMDNIQSEVPEQLLASLELRDRQRLDAIEAALRRIETGSYGLCTSCGHRIEAGRLEALPAAELCILCQHATERAMAVA